MTKQQMELDLMVNKQGMALVLLKSAPNPMEQTTHEYIIKNLKDVADYLDGQLKKALARGQGECESVPQFMEVPDGIA